MDSVVRLEGAVVGGILNHTHNQIHTVSASESLGIERELQVIDRQHSGVDFRQNGQIGGAGGGKVEEMGPAMRMCGDVAVNVGGL